MPTIQEQDDRYMADPVIKEIFGDLHKTWKHMEAAWKRGDYGSVCFRLGELHGIVSRVYMRNAQIDRGEP